MSVSRPFPLLRKEPRYSDITTGIPAIALLGANALNLVSTRGIEITIGDGIGTTPDKYRTATGTSMNYGLVTQLKG